MKAMVLTGHGGMDKLVYREDYPKPSASAGEVLIRVRACGLNNTDINTRTGWYSQSTGGTTTAEAANSASAQDAAWGGKPLTFPLIQGADAVGIVEGVGAGVDDSIIGKRVMIDCWLRDKDNPDDNNKTGYFGSECNGGFADYAVVDARNAYPVDSTLSDAELATFSTSYLTAEQMLNRANVGDDDVVLITGASGGVGSALIQLAKRRKAKTIALCAEDKASALGALNPDVILPRNPADIMAALNDAGFADGVSVVADVVGGKIFPQLINVLQRKGRYVCSGAIAGAGVALDLRIMYLRDLTLIGSTVTPPQVFPDLIAYIERGEVRPLLAKTFPLKQLHQAQEMFMAKNHIGNIAVVMDD